jgi:hypothetical protein
MTILKRFTENYLVVAAMLGLADILERVLRQRPMTTYTRGRAHM